ncbi:MAG: hypothetical protein AVDCRST_MAG49-4148 [uncultured Thermomicrobiales bacterium]|uniref:Uncharacterized protein n=1 Tax=uncultured Thermomicrobiales bacterium TaxID=1645740 RepID=A0A6J4VD61_9BACT|nr:MAG: hypothetical protein AVDCRST_MAG49-4148 [uncultured Thermomicrobiales bacterium]
MVAAAGHGACCWTVGCARTSSAPDPRWRHADREKDSAAQPEPASSGGQRAVLARDRDESGVDPGDDGE